MQSTDSIVLGIDLGTTNSSVAVVHDGIITVIPVNGNLSMPSAVGIDPAGRLIIGQAAKNQAISAPENTVLSVKRLMGTDQTVELGGKSYRPEEISALILGELKRAAETHLGNPVKRAVITVPAFFNERQRLATQDAGILAGLEVLRIINEPTAAALAYGAGDHQESPNETLLVYDLGGGTFDVSLVQVQDGIVEVRASHGDVHLGGDDFDEALAKLGEQRLQEKSGDSAPLPPAALRRLKSAMENAKISLSDAPFANVREEYLTPTHHLETEIARSDYEDLITPLLRKTLDCVQQTLSDAQATASTISKIMLVGGATRTPLVQDMLASSLGMLPRHEINPDLVVAMGAAIQGAALAGQPAPAVLIDISAHTYSLIVVSDSDYGMTTRCFPLIRRGTPLPVTKSEVFFTHLPHQTKVNIEVCQGESNHPNRNVRIGDFVIEGLTDSPELIAVVVQFRIDLNGLLTVTATEKDTQLAKSVTIDTAGQHRINLDAARTNLNALFAEQDANQPDADDDLEAGEFVDLDLDDFDEEEEDDDEPDYAEAATVLQPRQTATSEAEAQRLLASAKSLRTRARMLLDRGIPITDANSIQHALDTIGPAIESRDWAGLKTHLDTLSDLLFYLED